MWIRAGNINFGACLPSCLVVTEEIQSSAFFTLLIFPLCFPCQECPCRKMRAGVDILEQNVTGAPLKWNLGSSSLSQLGSVSLPTCPLWLLCFHNCWKIQGHIWRVPRCFVPLQTNCLLGLNHFWVVFKPAGKGIFRAVGWTGPVWVQLRECNDFCLRGRKVKQRLQHLLPALHKCSVLF